ncbi:hypothetical protein Tco_0658287 [Tanacetum coccineum]
MLNESIVVPTTSKSEYTKEEDDDEIIEWVDTGEEEEKKDDDDNKSINLEQTNDEETDDEFVHGKEHVQDNDDELVHCDEQVNDDEDEEMTNAKVEESRNGDKEITDAAKVDAEKTEEVKDDAKKAELPPISSSLLVSSGFGDQFLKFLSDTSLIGIVKDTADAEINSLLDIKIESEVPHIQSQPVLTIPVSVIFEPSVLTPIPETPLVAPATTLLLPPSVSTIPPVLLQTTTPIPTLLITTKAPTITIVVLESNALTVLQRYTAELIQKYSVNLAPEPSKIQTPTIELEPESEKSALEIRKIKKEQAEKQKMSKYIIKSTNKVALKEYDQKSALYQTMNENKTFNRNPANHALYHALMEALIEDENSMDKGVADTEPIEEPIAEVVMDDLETTANEHVVNDADRPAFNLLKGTCTSSIELEYNMEECFKALTDRLDWNNPEGDCCPFDLTKPLPLKGRSGCLTVAAE